MSHPLLSLREGPVARLRLNRPELHNAFDAMLIAALTGALEAAGKDDSIRVVVLEGEGSSFSAGADLNWMRGMAGASEAANREDALALARLMRTLDELPKPTVARVHGAAFGGGVGLVACCDIALGTPEARFGLTESKLGLLPAVISPYVIEAVGARQARRWFATAEIFDADEAKRIGLLHDVVEAAALDGAIQRQLDLLLKAGPVAAASAKRLVRRVADETSRDRLDADNAALIAQLRVSPEGQEGLGAFLDKRKPAWCNWTPKENVMLDHIGITVADFDASKAFYARVLAPLGYGAVMEVTPEMTGTDARHLGFGADGSPDFWIGAGTGAAVTRDGLHIAFSARSRAAVDAFHQAALAAGARDNGAPGIRAHYHPNYYGAFVIDLNGHNIEAVCHAPE